MPTALRGCGSRSAGGLYLELKTDPKGRPLEEFLLDPAIRIGKEWEEEKGLKLSSVGVRIFMQVIKGKDGMPDRKVKHVIDVIGKRHYPNLSDYVEELAQLGISRKLSRKLDLSGLGKESLLYLAHDKAWVGNTREYGFWKCIKQKEFHDPERLPHEDACCSGVWWQDLEPDAKNQVILDRYVKRTMPAFTYKGYLRPQGLVPKYERGIFAIFPLVAANLAVIRGPGSDVSMAAAQKADLPIEEAED